MLRHLSRSVRDPQVRRAVCRPQCAVAATPPLHSSMTPPRLAPDAPLFVVFNPGSGRGDAQRTRAAIEAGCRKAGRPLTLLTLDGAHPLPATLDRGSPFPLCSRQSGTRERLLVSLQHRLGRARSHCAFSRCILSRRVPLPSLPAQFRGIRSGHLPIPHAPECSPLLHGLHLGRRTSPPAPWLHAAINIPPE